MPLDIAVPILIVDDHKMMVDLIREIAKSLGFEEVDYALDGTDALALLREKVYGLVISDLQMEPMGGLQLLRAVRADEKLRRIPFIMTSASMEAPHVVAAKHAGVDAYLLKPFTPTQLKAKLDAVRPA
jgi:two-component system chemotaxis response regulator CheY